MEIVNVFALDVLGLAFAVVCLIETEMIPQKAERSAT
jgi:hypothetical protein